MTRMCTQDEARAAFKSARAALEQRPTTAEMSEIFLRFHNLVLSRQNELLDTIQKETGKARSHAFDEVMDVAITSRYYAKRAPKLLGKQRRKGALPYFTRTHVERAPIGVVGIIAPWNYPLSLAISDAIPALLAGNAVVLKPDEKTPETALLAASIAYDAGLSKDLLQVIPGEGPVVGKAIAEECDYLMFTGSTETGRALGRIAGERLIGFSAELGGKNPMLIDRSADPARAARIAVQACFANSGQLCISVERIFVHRDIEVEFTQYFLDAVRKIRVGRGGWEFDMGELISEKHAARVHEFVQDAAAQGASVLTGGSAPKGRIYQPTVLAHVPDNARLRREEVFGPVVYLEAVDSMEEAINKANDSDYGLSAAVVAKPAVARRIASRLQAGTVNINEGFAAAWASVDAPMGGWKNSGVGRRHGAEGLLKFTETRTVAEQRVLPLGRLSTPPFTHLVGPMLKLGRRFL